MYSYYHLNPSGWFATDPESSAREKKKHEADLSPLDLQHSVAPFPHLLVKLICLLSDKTRG